MFNELDNKTYDTFVRNLIELESVRKVIQNSYFKANNKIQKHFLTYKTKTDEIKIDLDIIPLQQLKISSIIESAFGYSQKTIDSLVEQEQITIDNKILSNADLTLDKFLKINQNEVLLIEHLDTQRWIHLETTTTPKDQELFSVSTKELIKALSSLITALRISIHQDFKI